MSSLGQLIREGRNEEALKSFEELMSQICILGLDHEETVRIRTALILVKEMQYDKAFDIYKDIFLRRRSIVANAHPDRAEKACCTGHLPTTGGNVKEVEEVCSNVVSVFRDHSDELYKQGRLYEALTSGRKIYENVTELLSSNSPVTLEIKKLVGKIYMAMEKYDDALKCFDEIYRKHLEIQSRDHTETLDSLILQVKVLQKKCEFMDAATILYEAQEYKKKNFEIRDTKVSYFARALKQLTSEEGECKHAQDEFLSMIEEQGDLGNDMEVLVIKDDLASSYYTQGKYEDALKTWREIVDFQNLKYRSYTENMLTYSKIAKIRLLQGEYDKAKRIYEEIQESIDIPEEAMAAENNIVVILAKKEGFKYSSALQRFSELSEKSNRMFGLTHSVTLSIRSNLGTFLCSQKRYDEALDVCNNVLGAKERSLSFYHPDTLKAKCAVARVYFYRGNYDKALSLYNEVRYLIHSTLTPSHPDCLSLDSEIAEIHRLEGKYNKAFQIYYDLYERKGDIYGIDHAYTSEIGEKMSDIPAEEHRLITATENANLEIVTSCLEDGDDIDVRDNRGNTPLHIASEKGYTEILRHLLEKGAFHAARNLERKTPEDIARNWEVKNLLHLVDTLFEYTERDRVVAVENILIEGKGILNAKNKNGYTLLHVAADKGCKDILKLLLGKGVNYKAGAVNGTTALHAAVLKGHIDTISILLNHVRQNGTVELKKFINVESTTEGMTALHLAAQRDNLRTVKSLLGYGANSKIKNKHKKLPSDLTRNGLIKHLLLN